MALQGITISLRGWIPQGILKRGSFVLPLEAYTSDSRIRAIRIGKSRGQSSKIVFLEINRDDFKAFEEPDEALEHIIQETFGHITQWLRARPTAVFDQLRQQGIEMDIYIGTWIDDDQIDLSFPSEFLAACGQHQLSITLISND